jgi:hypothetical protein
MKAAGALLAGVLVLAGVQIAQAAKKLADDSIAAKCQALAKAQTKSKERQATLVTVCLNNGGKL